MECIWNFKRVYIQIMWDRIHPCNNFKMPQQVIKALPQVIGLEFNPWLFWLQSPVLFASQQLDYILLQGPTFQTTTDPLY